MNEKGSGKKKFEIVTKSEDHGKWFQELLLRSGMIDYTDVSGCYVLKPWAFSIWETIKSNLDLQIKMRGVENTYFPMLVSETNLKKEESHLEDFAPEVAWIATPDKDNEENNKGDKKEVRERYAIRPTSETIIYPHFANWMKETGIYPKINQWCNVLRWESKDCTPFIRSREFLWQEGHTCHPNKDSAVLEMWDILKVYTDIYSELLAVPMIPGLKTKSETFPGAELTSTIEGFLPDSGKAIQSATSHYLGTNFAKMFDIKGGDGELVHQNSWGLTTRSIGIMVMTHSDEKGLVVPPRVAPIQVVLVACGLTKNIEESVKEEIGTKLSELQTQIKKSGIGRCVYDNLPKETPGMKFNKWEIKGVPLRIELGPRDLQNDQVTLFRRDTLEKWTYSLSGILADPEYIVRTLNGIHDSMLGRARDRVKDSITFIDSDIVFEEDNDALEQIVKNLEAKKLVLIRRPYFDRVGSKSEAEFETKLKQYCASRSINSTKCLCIPNSDTLADLGFEDCIDQKDVDGNPITYVLYGRSY